MIEINPFFDVKEKENIKKVKYMIINLNILKIIEFLKFLK